MLLKWPCKCSVLCLCKQKGRLPHQNELISIDEYTEGEEPDWYDRISYSWYVFKFYLGWYDRRTSIKMVSCTIIWVGVGVVYWMHFEGGDFIQGLYFAVSALSTAGLSTPTCNGDVHHCSVPTNRAIYLSLYLLVGVPLYATTMGQFAGQCLRELMP